MCAGTYAACGGRCVLTYLGPCSQASEHRNVQQIFPFAVEGIFSDDPFEDWPTDTFITWVELMVRHSTHRDCVTYVRRPRAVGFKEKRGGWRALTDLRFLSRR